MGVYLTHKLFFTLRQSIVALFEAQLINPFRKPHTSYSCIIAVQGSLWFISVVSYSSPKGVLSGAVSLAQSDVEEQKLQILHGCF